MAIFQPASSHFPRQPVSPNEAGGHLDGEEWTEFNRMIDEMAETSASRGENEFQLREEQLKQQE